MSSFQHSTTTNNSPFIRSINSTSNIDSDYQNGSTLPPIKEEQHRERHETSKGIHQDQQPTVPVIASGGNIHSPVAYYPIPYGGYYPPTVTFDGQQQGWYPYPIYHVPMSPAMQHHHQPHPNQFIYVQHPAYSGATSATAAVPVIPTQEVQQSPSAHNSPPAEYAHIRSDTAATGTISSTMSPPPAEMTEHMNMLSDGEIKELLANVAHTRRNLYIRGLAAHTTDAHLYQLCSMYDYH